MTYEENLRKTAEELASEKMIPDYKHDLTATTAVSKQVYVSPENMQYIRQMLGRGWRVYLYRRGRELVPTGVVWNVGSPAFVIKPKH